MPYTIEDFPIETSEARLEVSLPAGKHVFELVVEDTAGLKSLPDRVVITVTREQVNPPIITGIRDRFSLLGETIETVIVGQNLRYVSKVAFMRDGQEDTRVVVTVNEGTDNELPISVRVMGNAAIGVRSLKLVNPGGEGESPADITFTIVGQPVIDNFLPNRANCGESVELTVRGRYLLVESEPLKDHRVQFLSEPDSSIEATIRTNSTAKEITLDFTVPQNATPGKYTLSITTPATKVEVSDKFFEVQP